MRHRYIWDESRGEVVSVGEFYAKSTVDHRGITVIPDIQPYISVIDRKPIQGRRQHRDHLKAHGCVEVGNEPFKPRKEVHESARYDIRRAMESPALRAEAAYYSEKARGAIND